MGKAGGKARHMTGVGCVKPPLNKGEMNVGITEGPRLPEINEQPGPEGPHPVGTWKIQGARGARAGRDHTVKGC